MTNNADSTTVRTTVRLRIVGVNDVYSLDALPRLASCIKSARTNDPADHLLITMAGDFLAPSLLSSMDQGRGMVDCLNALGVTHVTLGNHEDDLETDALLERLGELSAAVVLTNVPDFRGRHVASDTVDVGGHRVGLVGVVNGDPSLYHRAPFGGAEVGPTNETVARAAKELRIKGCVAVVALTHQRVTHDRVLADMGVVDLILGGHDHEGYIETNHLAPLAKAPMNAAAALVATMTFDASVPGRVRVRTEVQLEPMRGYPEDEAMRARVDSHLAGVRALEARTLLRLPDGEVLSSAGARQMQSSFGTLVCSRLRDTLGADMAVFNGGGLRGETERRESLTYAAFQEELPFENEVVVVAMPGAVIRDAIRFSRTELVGTGGFLQVDDGSEVDPEHVLRSVGGASFDPERTYRVAIVRELMLSLDQIKPLLAFARRHPEAIPDATTGIEAKVALLRTFEATERAIDA